jgi:signal transduction histidine kinase
MATARDSGTAAASGMVELVQEIEGQKQPGFLIYLPVYQAGAIPSTLEERRAKLLGFAYSPIRAGDFLSTAFRAPPGVTLSVYHGSAAVPEMLLYRSDNAARAARRTRTSTVDVVGQPWTFVFHSRSSPYDALALPMLAAAGGAVLSWLLAVLVRRQGDAQREAQRALERERAARTEAEHANVVKDEFIATVSHELRTPLSAIVGWAEVLRTGKLPESEIPKAIEVVHRNAKAQAQLIDDLLDMNRIITGKMRLDLQPLELARAVEEAIASARPAADAKGVRLQPLIG